jgi:hypothetical protein
MSTFETYETDFDVTKYSIETPEFNPYTGTYERLTYGQAGRIQGSAEENYPTHFEDPEQFPGPVYVDESV